KRHTPQPEPPLERARTPSRHHAFAFSENEPSVDGNGSPFFDAATWPVHAHRRRLARVAESHEHTRIVRRRVAAVGARAAPECRRVLAKNLDARPEHVASLDAFRTRAAARALRARADQPQADPMVSVPNRVDEKSDGPVDVAYHHVYVAVVVDVSECCAAADFDALEHGACLPSDVLESSVVQVPEQQRALAVRKSFVHAILDGLDGSVDGQDVQPAVVVEVEPCSTESGVTETHRAKSRRGAEVLEETRTVVHVEIASLNRQLSGEEILVSVVVEIAGVDSHAPFRFAVGAHGSARKQTRVLEGTVPLVDPQHVVAGIVR